MNRRRIRQHLSVYLVIGLSSLLRHDAVSISRQALQGGATIIQLREKEAPLGLVIQQGILIRNLCRDYHVPFIVNDRIDLAMLLNADGVHLGQDDIPCHMAREMLGHDKIIGVSAGTMEEAKQAIEDGADYVGVGPVYPTLTKKDAGEAIGTRLIARIRQELGIPTVGIGGIQADNAAAVITAGADGIAVVSAITHHSNPQAAAQQLRQIVIEASLQQ